LAKDLEESGVHVIIDKWDLREGADKYAFMEKMVTDPAVRKVIVICDRLYAEKADGRKGGVGTETQIISKEVYEQVDLTDQKQKFVAVITEKDEEGKPYVPTFLKSRIYIDMSDTGSYAESLEQLLRWIYDKPLHKRPERGKPPAYIFTEDKLSLGTSPRFRLAMEALKQNKATALGAVRDYFETFAQNLESLRIEPEEGKEFDDQVVESIEAFLPYRDEAIELFLAIARYRSDPEMYEDIRNFFERILPYGFWPAGRSSWQEWNADNFRFIMYELFLYLISALLKNNRFEMVNKLVEPDYYFPPGSPELVEDGLISFTFFQRHLESIENRNRRLKLNRLSLTGDLIKQRAKRNDLTFDDIMQSDFVLFIRSELCPREDNYSYRRWFPYTLVYAFLRGKAFEIFARAQSLSYFDRMKVAIGVTSRDELIKLIEEYRNGERQIPSWGGRPFNPAALMNIMKIATQP
jgi:hypothetical protein